SEFVVKNIFRPVYERYAEALSSSAQIDFTDAILQATELCRATHPVEYDYIIVDEFQDISVDRYNFLKVLREGNPPAKLYCVGDDWQSIYRVSGSDMRSEERRVGREIWKWRAGSYKKMHAHGPVDQ